MKTDTNASGTKHDGGKPPLALLPTEALLEVARVFNFGAAKYGADNWRGGFESRRLTSAALRHILADNSGEDIDNESGRLHLAHAVATLLFLIEQRLLGTGTDDRFKYGR